MPNVKEHVKKSQEIFKEASLGQSFQELLDKHQFLGPHHRMIDHDWERLRQIGEEYGEQGLKEIILHLAMDYRLYGSKERHDITIRIEQMREEYFASKELLKPKVKMLA